MDCIAIAHTDDAEDKMLAWSYKDDTVWVEHLETTVIGRWFKVHDNHNGLPVWRKEGARIWIWMDLWQAGWVMGTDMVSLKDTTQIAYAPQDGQNWPRLLHIPFWSKRSSTMANLIIAYRNI